LDKDTQNLWTIKTDGSGNRLLVPHPMKQYLISADLEQVVFFTTGTQLFHYNTTSGVLTKLWESERYGSDSTPYSDLGVVNTIDQVAISPSGNQVAWVLQVRIGRSKLHIYDLSAGRTTIFDYRSGGSVIAWSENDDSIYIQCPPLKNSDIPGIQGIAKFVISNEQISIDSSSDRNNLEYANTYGRFGYRSFEGGKVHTDRYSDVCKDLKVQAVRSPSGPALRVIRKGETVLSFSNSPFFAPLSGGWIHDPSFVQEGMECLFESGANIYLINVPEKKLGRLVQGGEHIVLTRSYQQGFNSMQE
jgi:hypothetical protein